LEVGVEGVDDSGVSSGFVGPAALGGVVSEDPDVVALRGEEVGLVGVGDEVVALFADVGVGARSGDWAREQKPWAMRVLSISLWSQSILEGPARLVPAGIVNSERRPLTLATAVS
jgi:hypothetical protein